MPSVPSKKYPYRKAGIILIVIAIALGIVGFLLMSTAQDSLAAASVAWIPAGLLLFTGLFFLNWDGKGDSDGGMNGPL